MLTECMVEWMKAGSGALSCLLSKRMDNWLSGGHSKRLPPPSLQGSPEQCSPAPNTIFSLSLFLFLQGNHRPSSVSCLEAIISAALCLLPLKASFLIHSFKDILTGMSTNGLSWFLFRGQVYTLKGINFQVFQVILRK